MYAGLLFGLIDAWYVVWSVALPTPDTDEFVKFRERPRANKLLFGKELSIFIERLREYHMTSSE